MPARSSKSIPDDFMRRMPEPHAYFASALPDLTEPDEHGWASAVCPLGRHPRGHRVRIDVERGRFSCATCGRGDLILFHMLYRRTDSFRQAVLELIADYTP